jgi:hypothetical protein
MKHCGLHVLLSVFLLSCFASGQQGTLNIVPETIVYKRTAPHVGESRRAFTVRRPVINGGTSRAASAKIQKQLNFWKSFEISFKDELEVGAYLERFDYEVKYNKDYLLSIWLTAETVAAYPDRFIRYLVFDVRTGTKLETSDLIKAGSLPDLQSAVRWKMREELERFPDGAFLYNQQFEFGGEEFFPKPENLMLKDLQGFSVSPDGITFFFDYGFPHISKSSEPPGEFFFSWKEMEPFIKRDGLLARFVR